jgi:hypothetical protein
MISVCKQARGLHVIDVTGTIALRQALVPRLRSEYVRLSLSNQTFFESWLYYQ